MSRARIVVIEDEGIVALDITKKLEKLGCAVPAISSSGESAIQEVAEIRPDLVLMNINQNGAIDGVEAAEEIWTRFSIPVICLTAFADDQALQRAKIAEPLDYILKPFEERELHTAVDMALHRHDIATRRSERERWLTTTLNSIGDAVITTDESSCITFMNPVAEALTGWKREEVLGKCIEAVFTVVYEDTGALTQSPVAQAFQQRAAVGPLRRTLLITKAGERILIDHNTAPIRDEEENISGAVLVFRDITQLVHAEKEILRHNRQLRDLQSAGAAIASRLDLEQVLETVTREMVNLVTAEACLIFEWNEEVNAISLLAEHDSARGSQASALAESCGLAECPELLQVLTDRHPRQMTIDPLDRCPPGSASEQPPDAKAMLVLPMISRDRAEGLIGIVDEIGRTFEHQKVSLAQTLANQAASAIMNARFYQEIHRRVEELTALGAINQAITATLELQDSLATVADHTVRLLDAAAASVALHEKASDDLWFAAASGEGSDYVRGRRLKMGQGIIGWVVESGEPVLVPDVTRDSRFCGEFDRASGFTTRSIMCVPLQTKGQSIGAIEVINKKGELFDEAGLRLLSSLASSAATAIQNGRLYQQAQQEIAERRRAEAALESERASLAQRVLARTAELREANAELAEASKLKDRFISNVSHELRTPLSLITLLTGNLELLYDSLDDDRRRRMIRDIRDYGRVLADLITSLLEISRIDSGRVATEWKQVSLTQLTCEEVDKQLPLAWEKSQTLDVTGCEGLNIWGDDGQLRQVIRNLLNNAIKYTPNGGQIRCECRVHDGNGHGEAGWPGTADLPDGPWAAVRVIDTGIGISQEDLSHLFERFYRVNPQGNTPGVGLGLAIAKGLVELHGGRIAVTSSLGEGTEFAVYLPLVMER